MENGMDTLHWHVLLGMMLGSKEIRVQAVKAILPNDVPSELRALWTALATGDGRKVWDAIGAIGLPVPTTELPSSVASRLIQAVQEVNLEKFVKTQVSRAEFSHKAAIGAEAVADTFESVAAAIRQRQAQISVGQNGKQA